MKINQCILLIFILTIISSCKEKRELPTLDEEIIIPILVDMHIAQEMISKFKETHRDSVRRLFMHEISEIHGIDSSLITQQLEIIQANPEYSFKLYEKVYKKIDKIDNIEVNKNKSETDGK